MARKRASRRSPLLPVLKSLDSLLCYLVWYKIGLGESELKSPNSHNSQLILPLLENLFLSPARASYLGLFFFLA